MEENLIWLAPMLGLAIFCWLLGLANFRREGASKFGLFALAFAFLSILFFAYVGLTEGPM